MSEVERASINTFAAIEMVDRYWKFDENQQPTSSWHDKQELLDALMRASVVAPIVSGRADQDEASDDLDVLRKAWDAISFSRFGNEDWVTRTKNDIAMRIAKELERANQK
jgi:hypothetical protein